MRHEMHEPIKEHLKEVVGVQKDEWGSGYGGGYAKPRMPKRGAGLRNFKRQMGNIKPKRF